MDRSNEGVLRPLALLISGSLHQTYKRYLTIAAFLLLDPLINFFTMYPDILRRFDA